MCFNKLPLEDSCPHCLYWLLWCEQFSTEANSFFHQGGKPRTKEPRSFTNSFFSLNGQQSKENVYRTKITKKKTLKRNRRWGSYIRISQSPKRAQSLSVSSSSPCGWGCWLPLGNLPRTHRICANSSQS